MLQRLHPNTDSQTQDGRPSPKGINAWVKTSRGTNRSSVLLQLTVSCPQQDDVGKLSRDMVSMIDGLLPSRSSIKLNFILSTVSGEKEIIVDNLAHGLNIAPNRR